MHPFNPFRYESDIKSNGSQPQTLWLQHARFMGYLRWQRSPPFRFRGIRF